MDSKPVKTIDDAIAVALCVGPLSQVKDRIKGEVNGYLSDEIAPYLGLKPRMDPLAEMEWVQKYEIIAGFLQYVMNKQATKL
jgi:hypothetical protein